MVACSNHLRYLYLKKPHPSGWGASFSMYTYKMSRNDIRINFNAFDIPEENHKVFTATEYINRHNITFEG